MAGPKLGRMGEFDPETEDWEAYTERFDLYCNVNEVNDTKKVATLLTVIGPKS